LVISYRKFIICVLGSAVRFKNGYVVPETDRRYDDITRIIEALEADVGGRGVQSAREL
jgi:hypothetical protein